MSAMSRWPDVVRDMSYEVLESDRVYPGGANVGPDGPERPWEQSTLSSPILSLDVTSWLGAHGFGRYADRFAEGEMRARL